MILIWEGRELSFLQFCNLFNIPILFFSLQKNYLGFIKNGRGEALLDNSKEFKVPVSTV